MCTFYKIVASDQNNVLILKEGENRNNLFVSANLEQTPKTLILTRKRLQKPHSAQKQIRECQHHPSEVTRVQRRYSSFHHNSARRILIYHFNLASGDGGRGVPGPWDRDPRFKFKSTVLNNYYIGR